MSEEELLERKEFVGNYILFMHNEIVRYKEKIREYKKEIKQINKMLDKTYGKEYMSKIKRVIILEGIE